jgi:hypothetical protein
VLCRWRSRTERSDDREKREAARPRRGGDAVHRKNEHYVKGTFA